MDTLYINLNSTDSHRAHTADILVSILTATSSALIHHRTVVVDLVKALLATQWIYNWNVTIVMNAIISDWHGLRIIVVIGTRWMRWRCYIRIRIIMWIHCYWGGQLDGFFIYTRLGRNGLQQQRSNDGNHTTEIGEMRVERTSDSSSSDGNGGPIAFEAIQMQMAHAIRLDHTTMKIGAPAKPTQVSYSALCSTMNRRLF